VPALELEVLGHGRRGDLACEAVTLTLSVVRVRCDR
jgi:hypothetical protein